MVIICLIICNNVGNIIFARQFIPLFSKKDLFHHSSIFIKNYSINSELKYLDIPPFRYSYQLLNEKLVLILISKLKNNNNIIIEQETLKNCYRLIQQRIGTDLNELSIKKEGINLAIDLEEIVQNGLVQNLNFGEINTNINMIRIDKDEKKKIIEMKLNKQKNNMIKQFNEMEKLEKLNDKSNFFSEINIDLNNKINENNHNINKERESNMMHDCIRLNYNFDIVKVEKPIVFKTPSGKVVLLAEQKKAIENRKDKIINGMKLGEKK
jgi:hypothetical protein